MSWASSSSIPQEERGPQITQTRTRAAKRVEGLLNSKPQFNLAFVTAVDLLGRAIEGPTQWPMGCYSH